jgi:TnpA family transposase
MFLADYFVNEGFRRELLRVLNRGETVHCLERSSYVGRIAGCLQRIYRITRYFLTIV